MATFSLLKRFDFFNKMSNWFSPFYITHPELGAHADDEQGYFQRLLEGLARAFYLCNSDKFSFALNFNAVPLQQRSMIITYFEAELEQMKDMATEEEVLGQTTDSHTIFIQYIQDLYRFFKLFPHHNEFEDVFQKKFRFSESYFYREFFERNTFTEQLAAFYFEKEHYPEVIEIYHYIIEKNPPQAIYYEKLGFALQKTGAFESAVHAYKKAELFDTDRLWILKKLGWCCLKLKNYEEAARYFSDAANLRPDDLKIKAQLGQCYLNMGQFDLAIQHYSKVQYYQPDNLKVLRPIAYCHFVLGKLTEAEEIYQRIISSETATGFDFLNAGHVSLCLNRRSNALALYRKCFTDPGFSESIFLNSFEEDASVLVQHGITEGELRLIADYLLFQRN
jgi:tetratricopeptide (TPR) repeat protein